MCLVNLAQRLAAGAIDLLILTVLFNFYRMALNWGQRPAQSFSLRHHSTTTKSKMCSWCWLLRWVLIMKAASRHWRSDCSKFYFLFFFFHQDAPLLEGDKSFTATTTILVTILDADNRPPWLQPCAMQEIGDTVVCPSPVYTGSVYLNEQEVRIRPCLVFTNTSDQPADCVFSPCRQEYYHWNQDHFTPSMETPG